MQKGACIAAVMGPLAIGACLAGASCGLDKAGLGAVGDDGAATSATDSTTDDGPVATDDVLDEQPDDPAPKRDLPRRDPPNRDPPGGRSHFDPDVAGAPSPSAPAPAGVVEASPSSHRRPVRSSDATPRCQLGDDERREVVPTLGVGAVPVERCARR